MPTKKVSEADRKRCAQACDNCKSRKQRCDGRRPCHRCIRRRVAQQCRDGEAIRQSTYVVASSLPTPLPTRDESQPHQISETLSMPTARFPETTADVHQSVVDSLPDSVPLPISQAVSAPVPHMSRILQDTGGEHIFIGDSATLTFLQHIRRIVRKAVGDCGFTADPLRHHIVEASSSTQLEWLARTATEQAPTYSADDVEYFKTWFVQSANSCLLLFNEDELASDIDQWVREGSQPSSQNTAIYYLVFAIGAQTGPEDRDDQAGVFFDYARYITFAALVEHPNIPTIRAFALICMYLIGASRRNSAFMYLGIAVRAAYAIGLHRKDISQLFPARENKDRESLWKAIRTLDLFLSASLGRPLSTIETRNTASDEDYSASNDLCMIFEAVLSKVYVRRSFSIDTLESISRHHRRWVSQCTSGFQNDGIASNAELGAESSFKSTDMKLIHLKQTYHWTIILLSLPCFINVLSAHVSLKSSRENPAHQIGQSQPLRHDVMLCACVESAIRIIDLAQALEKNKPIAKRLPLVANCVFISGLVLGAAIFGDLDTTFPLAKVLGSAISILKGFHGDAVTVRHLAILGHLQSSCHKYLESRVQEAMTHGREMVSELFGDIQTLEQKARVVPTSFENGHNETTRSGRPTTSHTVDTIVYSRGGQEATDLTEPHGFSQNSFNLSSGIDWYSYFDPTTSLFSTVDTRLLEDDSWLEGLELM